MLLPPFQVSRSPLRSLSLGGQDFRQAYVSDLQAPFQDGGKIDLMNILSQLKRNNTHYSLKELVVLSLHLDLDKMQLINLIVWEKSNL